MAQTVKQGSNGPTVHQVQQLLNRAGGSAHPRLAEDAIFGPKTHARVVEFQRTRGLTPDGVVGPKTHAALGTSASPGVVAPPVAPGTGADLSKLPKAVLDATKGAHDLWRLQARLQGVVINGPTAIAPPGCVVGPDLKPLILLQPALAGFTGDARLVAQAAATGIGTQFKLWQSSAVIPGLPWYPSFAVVASTTAPPTPNIPAPIIALSSAGLGGLINASMLEAAMTAALTADVKARDSANAIKGALESASALVAIFFIAWTGSGMVRNVIGTGPVPHFAPPMVPVGAVVGGHVVPGLPPFL